MQPLNQSYVSLISASTALIATIFGPFFTLKSARLQAYASVLPNNRARWIESLRELISTAIGQMTAYLILRSAIPDHDRPAIARNLTLLARVEQSTQTICKIRLMLNPDEADSRELLATLESAMTLLRSQETQETVEREVQERIDQSVTICQKILKHEWLRVKQGN